MTHEEIAKTIGSAREAVHQYFKTIGKGWLYFFEQRRNKNRRKSKIISISVTKKV